MADLILDGNTQGDAAAVVVPLTVTVALDGPRQRDLRIYPGDATELEVVAYLNDGDETPLEVTNPRILTQAGALTFPVADAFSAPGLYSGRQAYRLVGEINGGTTTLATGDLLMQSFAARSGSTGVLPTGPLVLDGLGGSNALIYDGGGA